MQLLHNYLEVTEVHLRIAVLQFAPPHICQLYLLASLYIQQIQDFQWKHEISLTAEHLTLMEDLKVKKPAFIMSDTGILYCYCTD